jgi:hypothetical protein
LVLGGDELASHPICFTPGLKAPPSPNTYWIGGWVGFVTGLDVVAKREESCHYFCTPCNKIRRKVLTHVTVTSVFSGVCIYLNNFLPIYHQYKYQQYKLGYRAT